MAPLLLILVGVVLLFAGFLFSTPTTTGVCLAAAACFVGILARMVQAQEHQNEAMWSQRRAAAVAAAATAPAVASASEPLEIIKPTSRAQKAAFIALVIGLLFKIIWDNM